MSDWFKIADDTFRVLSEIATVVGVGGVFYAIKSFKKSEEDSRQTEQSKLMENSIEVLRIFSSNIIPQMIAFDKEWHANYDKLKKSFLEKAREENKDIKELPKPLEKVLVDLAKSETDIDGIFNRLEQVCAYVSYDLIIEDVVYPTIHKVFLDFLKENKELLKKLTSREVPFKNIHEVKNKWGKIAAQEDLDYKQAEINKEREELNKPN
ncbi:hypothetical protein [Lactococcus lactis]|uniref:hypothetical protein n=1 Tax=Lactococcus lactis TaxID=1358 RepID=UPI003563D210